jgi:DNA-binding CsgD family transcriptional regulator
MRASGLTQTERRVARLAARGLQNGEIAVELGLSVRTVERQLDRIFRRVGLPGDPLSPATNRWRTS